MIKINIYNNFLFSPPGSSYKNCGWPTYCFHGNREKSRYRAIKLYFKGTVSEFNEFKPRLKSAKNRFQLSAGLNLEKLNTILRGTNHI